MILKIVKWTLFKADLKYVLESSFEIELKKWRNFEFVGFNVSFILPSLQSK